jgi:hypothetical protein
MTINTKFNAGEQVYFLDGGFIYLRPIHRITIEVNYGGWGKEKTEPLITYHIILFPDEINPQEIYKYESELALSKEELMNTLEVL